MRLATWNINSVRLRKHLVSKFLQEFDIDILCLQETKVEDHLFPESHFTNIGYHKNFFKGEKSYNGVAVIARKEVEIKDNLEFFNTDKRHISVTFNYNNQDFELHNFYIPAGGDVPEISVNPKFLHKLEYVKSAGQWFISNRKPNDNIIIMGDFNIAPYENDVWSHKQLLKVVSHTPPEVEALNKMKSSINFIDVARQFIPESEKLYSWWSYRNRDWKKSNRGRRLDHIWTTDHLKNHIKNFEIIPDIRSWEQPSDHVPVIIELAA